MDDMVILSNSKEYLHKLFIDIKYYLKTNLNLEVKSNYQIFPVNTRGIDFVGYRVYHSHVLIRSKIKYNFIKMVKYNKNDKSIVSYNGWLNHANCINLKNKYLSYE